MPWNEDASSLIGNAVLHIWWCIFQLALFSPPFESEYCNSWWKFPSTISTSSLTKHIQIVRDCIHTRWFKLTFWSASWRSLNLWKGHLTIPKRSRIRSRTSKGDDGSIGTRKIGSFWSGKVENYYLDKGAWINLTKRILMQLAYM